VSGGVARARARDRERERGWSSLRCTCSCGNARAKSAALRKSRWWRLFLANRMEDEIPVTRRTSPYKYVCERLRGEKWFYISMQAESFHGERQIGRSHSASFRPSVASPLIPLFILRVLQGRNFTTSANPSGAAYH
jgi:hypothetical protein